MKTIFAVFFAMILAQSAQAEEVRSEMIKKLIADAIEAADLWQWSDESPAEDLGSIWAIRYSPFDDGTGFVSQGNPELFSFYILSKADRDNNGATDQMEVEVSLACGTEYDESYIEGYCDVTAEKNQGVWTATVKSCTCHAPQ